MVVNDELVNEIKNLSKKLDTSATDVISAAIELLKMSVDKELIIAEDNSQIKISLFKAHTLKKDVK